MQRFTAVLFTLLFSTSIAASIDTLHDTSDVHDCFLFSWANCDSETPDEDCRRHNTGSNYSLVCGVSGIGKEMRTLMLFPGYNDSLPDSSKLMLYNWMSSDQIERKIFLYPLTTRFFEGSEAATYGNPPDPDSGATWFHAWLDAGDACSLSWSNAGGDYTTAIACTTFITDDSQYYTFENFNRILHFWDTSAYDFGLILINENAFPSQSSAKWFLSSEYPNNKPLLILYYPAIDEGIPPRRRRIIEGLGKD